MLRLRLLIPALLALAAAAPAQAAEPRFYSYDPASEATRVLTGGVTLQVRPGLFGGGRLERLFSTRGRGSARLDGGERGPLSDGRLRDLLPEGAGERGVYAVVNEGDGAALTRVLCPGAQQAWFVSHRAKPLKDLRIHVVGQTPDGALRLCASLDYAFRGEWAQPPARALRSDEPSAAPSLR